MIYESLQLIINELNHYLGSLSEQDSDMAVLGNVAQLESNLPGPNDGNALLNKIVLTLINLEEEKTLKNLPNYKINQNQTEFRNAPVHLNLYVLFSSTSTSYNNALIYLSRVVQFFQGKYVFTHKNSPQNNQPGLGMEDFRLILDLHSPTFEESNFLWSTLGGKQLPHVIYKMRLVAIDREQTDELRGVIEETNSNTKTKAQ
ncbi:MAG: DUF4255 domain-containing protein [Bacteroidales bacterium]